MFVGDTTAVGDEYVWQRSKSTVALVRGDHVVWQWNFGPELNVPFFHPVATTAGQTLSQDRPADHAWHHGVWFCWKYINKINYWEHAGRTGRPAGKTDWSEVDVKTKDNGSATISLKLEYHPVDDSNVVLVEHRRIEISAPDAEGVYAMDWTCVFTAQDENVTLDRTPPKEQSWGGYAGLSIRFAKQFSERQTHDTNGLVAFDEGNRHRTQAVAMDYNGVIDGMPVGVAFLDHPSNPRHPTRWYAIRDPIMSYINAALLNDDPLVLKPHQTMTLKYRILVHPDRWSANRLQAAFAQFKSTKGRVQSE
jgi:hypothetical protein